MLKRWLLVSCLIGLLVACSGDTDEAPSPTPTSVVVVADPTPTLPPSSTPTSTRPTSPDQIQFITVAGEVPDRTGKFANFDEFGNVIGFDADLLGDIAVQAGIDTELIVTRHEGMLEAVANGEFDAAMSAITANEPIPDGVALTTPYLEIGQVLVVRANEEELKSYRDLTPEMKVAVVSETAGVTVARQTLGLNDDQVIQAESAPNALQELSDLKVRAAIVNHYDAKVYTERYYQRLKIAAQGSADEWLSSQSYVMAVAEDNPALLQLLNDAIGQVKSAEITDQFAGRWFVVDRPINAGDSLIGTPDDRFLVGVVGSVETLDPATTSYTPLEWEVKLNTMSGLLRTTVDGTLVPALAVDYPVVSADKLEYTFTLREDLTFPDGTPLNAAVARTSLLRTASTANRLFGILKDENLDGFADQDAIQVLGDYQLKFVLDEPEGHFLTLVATPPYAILSGACDPANFDPTGSCVGIGPYTVEAWALNESIRLVSNPAWPFDPVTMERVELRFYNSSELLRTALASGAVDLAWNGLNDEDVALLKISAEMTKWQGPGTFKSYLIFEQGQEPWDDQRLRQAVAYAVDREALVAQVFGEDRLPLYSPIPDRIPGQISAEPQHDLEQAIRLLNSAGYNSNNPLEIDLWYLNDGRYTIKERAYAEVLEAQLEATGIFQVNLNGEGWGSYSVQMSSCNYPLFLLGWPPSSRELHMEGLDWIAYFVYNAPNLCSNYDNPRMTELLDGLYELTDLGDRLNRYKEIQELWAQDLPTLDLYQDTRDAISLGKVTNLAIDPLGFLHYAELAK
ncbi:MAG: ABC transporter substrate-binding protein [Candidatus Promineifilaceae bacterium]